LQRGAGFAKLAKGAGLKIPSRRSSRVRIPYPALMHIDFKSSTSLEFFSRVQDSFSRATSRMI
jgi:hypothetical protein